MIQSSCGLKTLQTAPRAAFSVHITKARICRAISVCRAEKNASKDQQHASFVDIAKIPTVALLSAALLLASTPDEALAARSGGRVGGSSFSSRPRSAPSMPRSGGGATVRNYNYYSAPPIFSPYGFGGYGFGGGIGFFPVFGIGSIFNILILMFILNVTFNAIRNFTNGDNKKNFDSEDDDDRW